MSAVCLLQKRQCAYSIVSLAIQLVAIVADFTAIKLDLLSDVCVGFKVSTDNFIYEVYYFVEFYCPFDVKQPFAFQNFCLF